MTELLEAAASWQSLFLVVVVFGFAPGVCLRLIVLAYPRSDPRRAELIAELYAVPRIQRPLWVAEQLEVALFEGLAHRISAAGKRGMRGLAAGFGLLVVLGGVMLYASEQATTTEFMPPFTPIRFVVTPEGSVVTSVVTPDGRVRVIPERGRLDTDGAGVFWMRSDIVSGRASSGGASGWLSVLSVCLVIAGALITLVATWRQLRQLPRLLSRRDRTVAGRTDHPSP